ncbi:MAG: aminotransferase class I/II-fold pyridoxal phosphate-dependent enzyme [Streptosporangiales bacterium]|nr:aminotransferase class I/II-fold pyridoxal phosphate-dependent enzyme [Streptosporangiales bacterium]
MEPSDLAFDSKLVYYAPEPASQSISYPIYMSANYQYADDIYDKIVAGERRDVNIYSRCGNPTEYKLEEQVAKAAGADSCLATASGMAAVSHALFGLLKSGDHLVADWTTYSSTHEFFDHRITDYDIDVTFVDTADPLAVTKAITPRTKLVYFETVANPTMKVTPIPPLAEIAHERGIPLVCDNTFASPAVCQPHAFGVDVVVESATKFIGGHNDAVGGVITMRSDLLPQDWLEDVRWNTLNKLGGALSPFNAWLLLRGLQTLGLRVDRQSANAMTLARHLEEHPAVEAVWYPGLPSHPQHGVASEQLRNYGAMLTFAVADERAAVTVLKALRLASFAASLGGLRTTAQVPATMAFLDISPEQRQQMGVRDGAVRVSVGIEDASDVLADFDRALAQAYE